MKSTRTHLVTYLNDHLAGSVTLINLLDHLKRTKAGKNLKVSSENCGRIYGTTGKR